MRRALLVILLLAGGCAAPPSPDGTWERCSMRVLQIRRSTNAEPLQFVLDGTVYRNDGTREISFTVPVENETKAYVGLVSFRYVEVRPAGPPWKDPPYEGPQARILCRLEPDGRIGIDVDLGLVSGSAFRPLGSVSRIVNHGETINFVNPGSF